MSDIGIFSNTDIVLMILVALTPGALFGAGIGAWRSRGRRLNGALIGALIGFALGVPGWGLYFDLFK